MAFHLTACSHQSGPITSDENMEIMAFPYPKDYPSTNPMLNNVIEIVAPKKCVPVLDVDYGKDFKYYKVKTESKKVGYVIHTPTIKTCSEMAH